MSDYYDAGKMLSATEHTARQKVSGEQAKKVLEFFQANPDEAFTPFEVKRHALRTKPITSVRRAITDLTTAGYLEKTGDRKMGEYGQPNWTWKLRQDKPQGRLF